MDPRLFLAIISAKLLKTAIKLGKRGGGTAAPGLLALKIHPKLIEKLSAKLKNGSVVISGTNGKTTTSRIIASILSETKIETIHNRAGSNLERGIASTLIDHTNLAGKINEKIGLFEVDEAVVPSAIAKIKPKTVILTNLFRDQLDRYGEVDKTRRLWREALEKLPATTTVILNTDDPGIAHLGHNLKAKVIYFGIEDETFGQKKLSQSADTKYCATCSTPLTYKLVFASHLGKYACKTCQTARPKPQIWASKIKLLGIVKSEVLVRAQKERLSLTIFAGGLYNVYNLLAAVAVVKAMGIDKKAIIEGVEKFKTVFGRIEKFQIQGRKILMFLVKNPTGFNEVIRTIFETDDKKNVLIAINDLLADGRDVSWLWDVDFEKMAGKVKDTVTSGIRSKDMRLRLKYAGIDSTKEYKNIKEAIEKIVEETKKGEEIYFLPTYTAMLETRKILTKMGYAKRFWED